MIIIEKTILMEEMNIKKKIDNRKNKIMILIINKMAINKILKEIKIINNRKIRNKYKNFGVKNKFNKV
jgi:hypothetical protein